MTARPALAALLAAGCATVADPCGEVVGACVALHVDPSASAKSVDALALEISGAAEETVHKSTARLSSPAALPIAVALLFGDLGARQVDLTIGVSGMLGERRVGVGSGRIKLTQRQHGVLRVRLDAVSVDGGTDEATEEDLSPPPDEEIADAASPPPDLAVQDRAPADGATGDAARPDGGDAWPRQSSGTTNELLAVWGSGPSDVFVVGDRVILHSTNGGKTWQKQSPAATTYTAIWGSGPNDVYVTGATGVVLRTTDGGSTWLEVHSHNLPLFAVWGPEPEKLYAAGSSGTLIFSTDNGNTWKAQSSGVDSNLLSVWGSSASDVYVAGANRVLLHGNGSGAWNPVLAKGGESLNAIWGSGSKDVWVVGNRGTIWHGPSPSWQAVGVTYSGDILSIWGTSVGAAFAGGHDGRLLVASPVLGVWSPVTLGAQKLNGVWGTSVNDVYVVGGGGAIYHR